MNYDLLNFLKKIIGEYVLDLRGVFISANIYFYPNFVAANIAEGRNEGQVISELVSLMRSSAGNKQSIGLFDLLFIMPPVFFERNDAMLEFIEQHIEQTKPEMINDISLLSADKISSSDNISSDMAAVYQGESAEGIHIEEYAGVLLGDEQWRVLENYCNTYPAKNAIYRYGIDLDELMSRLKAFPIIIDSDLGRSGFSNDSRPIIIDPSDITGMFDRNIVSDVKDNMDALLVHELTHLIDYWLQINHVGSETDYLRGYAERFSPRLFGERNNVISHLTNEEKNEMYKLVEMLMNADNEAEKNEAAIAISDFSVKHNIDPHKFLAAYGPGGSNEDIDASKYFTNAGEFYAQANAIRSLMSSGYTTEQLRWAMDRPKHLDLEHMVIPDDFVAHYRSLGYDDYTLKEVWLDTVQRSHAQRIFDYIDAPDIEEFGLERGQQGFEFARSRNWYRYAKKHGW